MDKRAHERQPFEKTVNLAVTPSHLDGVVTVRLRGAMIDISAGGVGMWTNSPFGAGDKIRFNDEVGTRSGTVKWNTMVSDMHAYRVGIQFT